MLASIDFLAKIYLNGGILLHLCHWHLKMFLYFFLLHPDPFLFLQILLLFGNFFVICFCLVLDSFLIFLLLLHPNLNILEDLVIKGVSFLLNAVCLIQLLNQSILYWHFFYHFLREQILQNVIKVGRVNLLLWNA